MKKLIVLFFLLFNIVTAQTILLDSAALLNYPAITDLNVALQNPDAVVKLVLRKKKFKEFPMELLQFKNLQYLDISKNSIKSLPDSISKLKNLQHLACSKTGLVTIPNTIIALQELRYVNFNQNEIVFLPWGFGKLAKLQVADLWSNELESFPTSMPELTALRWMDLRNILIPQDKQDGLQKALPNARIYFSPPCKCSW
jgi:Leucine-rich repeat (LRR) protein